MRGLSILERRRATGESYHGIQGRKVIVPGEPVPELGDGQELPLMVHEVLLNVENSKMSVNANGPEVADGREESLVQLWRPFHRLLDWRHVFVHSHERNVCISRSFGSSSLPNWTIADSSLAPYFTWTLWIQTELELSGQSFSF